MTWDPANNASPRGRFGPMAEDHPSVGTPCAICGEPILAGSAPTLVMPFPADIEEAIKAAAGRPHTAEVQVAHETCAWQ